MAAPGAEEDCRRVPLFEEDTPLRFPVSLAELKRRVALAREAGTLGRDVFVRLERAPERFAKFCAICEGGSTRDCETGFKVNVTESGLDPCVCASPECAEQLFTAEELTEWMHEWVAGEGYVVFLNPGYKPECTGEVFWREYLEGYWDYLDAWRVTEELEDVAERFRKWAAGVPDDWVGTFTSYSAARDGYYSQEVIEELLRQVEGVRKRLEEEAPANRGDCCGLKPAMPGK